MGPSVILEADPQGAEAMALLREAAIEARGLYPELHGDGALWPTNQPTPPRGVYLVAFVAGVAVGMGAHRPMDDETTEVRRMYVRRAARRSGVARGILQAIEAHARAAGFNRLVLETGFRQLAAMRLYETHGFQRIAPFGAYQDDPTSVCYEKALIPHGPADI